MSRTPWLISYDIRDARRLRRLRKACLELGWPLQYSVFLANLDGAELARHEMKLRELIGEGDALSLIPVSTQRSPIHLGGSPLPHLYPDDPVLLDLLHPLIRTGRACVPTR